MIQRRLMTDPDINISRIDSPIVRRCLEYYTAYDNGDEICFIDVHNRYFFTMLQRKVSYSRMMTMNMDAWDPGTPLSHDVPILRAVYTVRHHRGKGLQATLIQQLIEWAEEYGEAFAVYADPYQLKRNGMPERNATEALCKFQYGYDPTDNYVYDLVKQRQRFLDAGLRNIKFEDARYTEPFQQFAYVPSTIGDDIQQLFDDLEVFYIVDEDKIKKK